jgi:hypothetical protein
MSAPFNIDLARPGRAQRSKWDWFLGPDGARHLAMVIAGGVGLVVLVGAAGLLPRYLEYSSEVQSIAKLRADVAAADRELSTLQASLRDVDAGARRRVRWSEILPVLSRSLPATLRIDRITLSKGSPPPKGTAASSTRLTESKPGDAKANELVLQIDASTTVVPGGSRLVDIANFMSDVAKDPAVNRRFQLKTWEVQRPREQSGDNQLRINIAFGEKRS